MLKLITEKAFTTEYQCQCGHMNTAYLALNNDISEANYGKQYYEFAAECAHCKVIVRMKFDAEPFTYGPEGDPYKSSIRQRSEFFQFDLKRAVTAYYRGVRWKIEEALRMVDEEHIQRVLEEIVTDQKIQADEIREQLLAACKAASYALYHGIYDEREPGQRLRAAIARAEGVEEWWPDKKPE